ncbi:MAG: di-trans,poly-cis-decaprenylcistransferase [Proteobacteria bacterium]|nr:di-trans,poly-cis-decaprenylcistransferase [Pseudomonadota bacterium]
MNEHLPQHIAIIMDGNGRWASKRGISRLKGHAEGAETVRRTCEEMLKLGIPYLTLYAFSTENWKRAQEEVSGLFGLMKTYFRKELSNLLKQNIRVRFIGDHSPTSRLEPEILALMQEVTQKTAACTALTATFAINYGGQDEITRAVQSLAQQITVGQLKPHEITPDIISGALDTAGTPPPDLIIRTSGEQRLSNFLLWQAAYAELYFADVSWPDFQATHLQAALSAYTTRQRRFGAVPSTTAA